MQLNRLSIINFKNYPEATIEFNSKINCITGENGQGKTNILDAIYYLSSCKSYFNPIDSQNILHNAPFFVIQGYFSKIGIEEDEIYCGLKRNQKKVFKKNKNEYDRLSDHIGQYAAIMISPADSDIISEGSEIRRKFIDTAISQFDKEYLELLITYNKILSQRNALLKDFSRKNNVNYMSLSVWDEQLIPLGEKIYEKRKNFIELFIPIFKKYYQTLSNHKEETGIEYQSHLNEPDFKEKYTNAIKRDIVLEYTTIGIHKDDLVFTINNYPIKKYASQGQQKSFVLSLKLALYEYIKNEKNEKPILLLDDIYDKLDDQRISYLMQLICSDEFGQIFITDTSPNRLFDIFEKSAVSFNIFKVQNGIINTITNSQAIA